MLQSNYPDHETLSRNLTKEEVQNPHKVFEDFFSNFNLMSARFHSREILKSLATGNFAENYNILDKRRVVNFHEWIEKLIEAIHVLQEREAKKR